MGANMPLVSTNELQFFKNSQVVLLKGNDLSWIKLRQPSIHAGERYSVGSCQSSAKLDSQPRFKNGPPFLCFGRSWGKTTLFGRDVFFCLTWGEENPLPPAKNVTAEVPEGNKTKLPTFCSLPVWQTQFVKELWGDTKLNLSMPQFYGLDVTSLGVNEKVRWWLQLWFEIAVSPRLVV